MTFSLDNFIRESNRIEGIETSERDLDTQKPMYQWFLALDEIKAHDLLKALGVIQPDAQLRDRPGVNVRIGNHHPTPGGPQVREELDDLLSELYLHPSPCITHMSFEALHPFTDGNGRTGRLLWLWMMKDQGRPFYHSFLKTWYYQSLDELI